MKFRSGRGRHGRHNSREYRAWNYMLQRCHNPKNSNWYLYGGRGIRVVKRWWKFENFYMDMGDRPNGLSLDRIDNAKGYGPDNCRWTDSKTQSRNRRSNVFLTYNGETKCIADWSIQTGIHHATIQSRMRYNWPLEFIFSVPNRRILVRRRLASGGQSHQDSVVESGQHSEKT